MLSALRGLRSTLALLPAEHSTEPATNAAKRLADALPDATDRLTQTRSQAADGFTDTAGQPTKGTAATTLLLRRLLLALLRNRLLRGHWLLALLWYGLLRYALLERLLRDRLLPLLWYGLLCRLAGQRDRLLPLLWNWLLWHALLALLRSHLLLALLWHGRLRGLAGLRGRRALAALIGLLIILISHVLVPPGYALSLARAARQLTWVGGRPRYHSGSGGRTDRRDEAPRCRCALKRKSASVAHLTKGVHDACPRGDLRTAARPRRRRGPCRT